MNFRLPLLTAAVATCGCSLVAGLGDVAGRDERDATSDVSDSSDASDTSDAEAERPVIAAEHRDVDTPGTNATVRFGECTGALIRDDLVATLSYCVKGLSVTGRWTPWTDGSVDVGLSAPWKVTRGVKHVFSRPEAGLALLALEQPIEASVAIPFELRTDEQWETDTYSIAMYQQTVRRKAFGTSPAFSIEVGKNVIGVKGAYADATPLTFGLTDRGATLVRSEGTAAQLMGLGLASPLEKELFISVVHPWTSVPRAPTLIASRWLLRAKQGARRRFDADRKSDLVAFDPASGQVYVFLSLGGTLAEPLLVASKLDSGTRVAGTGDFDGDGFSDLVLRNDTTGEVRLWRMRGATRVADELLFTDRNAQIVGVADIDANGRADIIMRYADLSVNAYRGGGLPNVRVGEAASSWTIATTGDVDGDGDDDVLWRNKPGPLGSVWLLERDTEYSNNEFKRYYLPTRSFVDAADFNGDGKDDIVTFDESSRVVTIITMSAASPGLELEAGTLPEGASIVAVGDLDGDFHADIIVRWGTTLLAWRNNGVGKFATTTLRTGVPESLTFIR